MGVPSLRAAIPSAPPADNRRMSPAHVRPYLRTSATELDNLAHENWDDLPLLVNVAVELLRRRTAYARSLRSDLIQRVTELILEDGFPWPTTEAPGGDGELEADWPETGMLRFLGYRVGINGLPQAERQEILDYVYLGELPPVKLSDVHGGVGTAEDGDTSPEARRVHRCIHPKRETQADHRSVGSSGGLGS
jgi:hypothetical protein